MKKDNLKNSELVLSKGKVQERIKLYFTKAQFNALVTMTDNTSAQAGGGDEEPDRESFRIVKHIDRMLNNNGYKRDFK